MRETLTPTMARRIALAAQGFCRRRPDAEVARRHVKQTVDRLGLFQIDSVNVVVRAHYMPLFSRLGPYDPTLIETLAGRRPRALFEYWAHEASFLPVSIQPLLRWRMAEAEAGRGIYKGLVAFARERRPFIDEIFAEIARRGPLAASDIEGHSGSGGWWGWSDAKRAFEWLFWAGHITVHSRRPSFERLYDLPERVLPANVLETPTPPREAAQRDLIAIAARAMGVATAGDLRDYFRLPVQGFSARVEELVEEGVMRPVAVRSWKQQAYLHKDATLPRKVEARALLAPFDPLVWERARAERLFGFRYRIEIYTPAEKRVHGYYVLPFLLGEHVVARLDIKADRQAGLLRVQAAHAQPGAPADTPRELSEELAIMAGWLGLDGVAVTPSGNLGPPLAAQMAITHRRIA